jgi:hypothetical protein
MTNVGSGLPEGWSSEAVGSAESVGFAGPPDGDGEPSPAVAVGRTGGVEGHGDPPGVAPGAAVPPFQGVAFGSTLVSGQGVEIGVVGAADEVGDGVALAARSHATTASATSSRRTVRGTRRGPCGARV